MKTISINNRAFAYLLALCILLPWLNIQGAFRELKSIENDKAVNAQQDSFSDLKKKSFSNNFQKSIDYFSVNQYFGDFKNFNKNNYKTLVTPQNGDFRTVPNSIASIFFNSPNNWQVYGSSGWQTATVSPQTASWTPENIFLESGSSIDVAGGRLYNNIYINTSARVFSSDNGTGLGIASGKTLEIISGNLTISGKITLNANSQLIVRSGSSLSFSNTASITSINSTALFEVENNANLLITEANPNLWGGVEVFHENSNVIISKWDDNLLFTNSTDISNNVYDSVSAKFGNLTIKTNHNWKQVFPTGNYQITHNDLSVENNTSGTNEMSLNGGDIIVGRDLTISGTGVTQMQTANGSKSLTVNRNFIKKDSGSFILLAKAGNKIATLNIKGNFDLTGGLFNMSNNTSDPNTSTVNLGGNFKKSSGPVISYLVNTNAGNVNVNFNFVGNPSNAVQTISSNANTTNNDLQNFFFNINANANVRLLKEWQVGTNTKVSVLNGGSLDFGLNGLTANNISRISNQISQSFELKSGGTLIITSPQGITNADAYTGNIQIGATAATRVFSGDATYKYIGRDNQSSGNGLPGAASAKKVIVDLFSDIFTFQPNGLKRINSNGFLEIRKGIVLDNSTGSFTDATDVNPITTDLGALKMIGGRYRLQKTDFNPGLSGTYDLTGGVIEFNNANAGEQKIRGPKIYYNIEVTGKNVWSTSGTISLRNQGSFIVKNNGEFGINTQTIDGPIGTQTLTVEDGGLFKTGDQDGFSGATNTSISNDIENIVLHNNSTVEYSRNGAQTITHAVATTTPSGANYANLKISGSGLKNATGTSIVNNVLSLESGDMVLPATANNIASNVLVAKKGIQNSGGTLTLENNALLMQDFDAVNSGNINVQRKAHVPANQYNIWSSPVVNQDLYALYGSANSVPAGKVMAYNTTTDYFVPVAQGTLSAQGKGYSAVGLSTNDVLAKFSGVPNNGDISIPLSVTGNRFNVVGNPYPSNLDLHSLYNDNVSSDPSGIKNITNLVRFWDNTNNTAYSQQGSSYQGQNYAIYNLDAGVGVPGTAATNGDQTKIPDAIVRPGQGFVVRANTSGNHVLNFKNTQRLSTANASTPYFKNEIPNKDCFWLALETPDAIFTTAAIAYNELATNDNDIYDTTILNPNQSDLLYSLSDNLYKQVIQSRKGVFIDTDEIRLGARYFSAGEHRFRVIKKTGIFENEQKIYLHDKLLNSYTDISEETYSFQVSAAVSNDESRFEIVYKPSTFLGSADLSRQDLMIFADVENIVVKSQSRLGKLQIYNMSGVLIFSKEVNSSELIIPASTFPKGIYVLKSDNNNRVLTKKFSK
ncbi:Por secretion system C-terminal sorting domain-containing protein [Soonwooa buanensis]|uniref:Por secretion system C-terminal sorting domain-containing protein n=1 Tax=Soonwooa buanensis TaxID=619805 RepID=A0A1T5EU78_9FLAO|nr:T9SS type A sorting domain-containing protein [Soonwooa buanensis]SKB87290.1 Por secretion system C-terminal sorting domain-containing protein [Soonwooa buanensis]